MVADQAEPLFRMEALAVERDDAGCLLPAVLERVQAERGDRRGVGMAEDAEYAAFLAQPIGFGIERRLRQVVENGPYSWRAIRASARKAA